MNKEQRSKVFKTNLRKLANEKGNGSFVIFEAEHEKFVQFAGGKEMGLLCDMPLAELSKDEQERLLILNEFASQEGSVDANTQERISYQTEYDEQDADKAAELAEKIFIQVFRLPASYSIVARLGS